MKLLILTQKVDINDDILGFFHDWLEEFAKHCQKLTVICLYKGEYNLPSNVRVLSLGKEKNSFSRLFNFQFFLRFKYLIRFYRLIWLEKKNYDKIFVHMNPEYVVLGGWFWKLSGKKIYLWYVHRSVNKKLKIAEKLADKIFTASLESFQIVSEKIVVIGHGINTEKFKTPDNKRPYQAGDIFNIIYVGRISRIKNQELLIEAVKFLVKESNIGHIRLELIGGTETKEDELYLRNIKQRIRENNLGNIVHLVGRVPNREIVSKYAQADLSINLCPTGGMDKAVLESMACGTPVIVMNQTFIPILKKWGDIMVLDEEDAGKLAQKIIFFKNQDRQEADSLGIELNKIILDNYSLDQAILKIAKKII